MHQMAMGKGQYVSYCSQARPLLVTLLVFAFVSGMPGVCARARALLCGARCVFRMQIHTDVRMKV